MIRAHLSLTTMRNLLTLLAVFLAVHGSAPLASGSVAIPECIESSEHAALTYFLLDRTDELKDTQNLQQTLRVLKSMVQSGERLIVGVSAAQASEARVIMDISRPKDSLWISKLKLRAGEKRFDDCFAKMSERVLQQGEVHKTSAILETLGVVAKVFATDTAAKKRVVIFSDMVQNSPQVSFFKPAKIDPAAELKLVEKSQLVVPFAAVEFHIAGAGTGSSDEKARSVEAFWKLYLEKAGAVLKFYGPVLFAS